MQSVLQLLKHKHTHSANMYKDKNCTIIGSNVKIFPERYMSSKQKKERGREKAKYYYYYSLIHVHT